MRKFWESIYSPNYISGYNPFILKDMNKAIERMVSAINNRKKIVVYGIPNVDGLPVPVPWGSGSAPCAHGRQLHSHHRVQPDASWNTDIGPVPFHAQGHGKARMEPGSGTVDAGFL